MFIFFLFLSLAIIILGYNMYKLGLEKGEEECLRSFVKKEGELVCKICGHTFIPNKDKVYTSREPIATGLSALTAKEPTLYSSIDCPQCSCQNILCIRQREVESNRDYITTNLLQEEENEENG